MKKKVSLLLALIILISSPVGIFAEKYDSGKLVSNRYSNPKIQFSQDISGIDKVYIVRKGKKIELEKTEKTESIGKTNKYSIDLESKTLTTTELLDKDYLVMENGKIKSSYIFNKGMFSANELVKADVENIDIYEKIENDDYIKELKSKNSFYNEYQIELNADDFNSVYVNDKKLDKTDGIYITDKQYNKKEKILTIILRDLDKVEFKKNDESKAIYQLDNGTLNSIKVVKLCSKKENKLELKKDEEKNTYKIRELREFDNIFKFYLKIDKEEILNEISAIIVNGITYNKSDSDIKFYENNKFYIDLENKNINISHLLPDKSVIKLLGNNKDILGIFKKENNEFKVIGDDKDDIRQDNPKEGKGEKSISENKGQTENIYPEPQKEKLESIKTFPKIEKNVYDSESDLKVKIEGSFESAVLNQKKYDSVSGATGVVTTNKNSDVKVYVQQVKKGEQVKEDQWKLLKDVDYITFREGFNRSKSNAKILGGDSGMQVAYNPFESSLILQGIPNKAGKYKVNIHLVDDMGREADSNDLEFNVYDLSKVTLNESLKNAKLNEFKYGNHKYWDLEPWKIEKFGGENETVTIPKNMNVLFGSHESGKYGYIGKAKVKGVEPKKQTLIIPKGMDFSLTNVQIFESVDIIVEEGAKLKLFDSSIYGRIIVKNGGIIQANYNSEEKVESKIFLTGNSINGQIILEDGATIENSSIYSNANSLTDGDSAKRIIDPVVEVHGNVNVKGKVFIRGDESPTGTDPKTNRPYKGQPALKIINGSLNVEKDSMLALYGGGIKATTTNGGDALILDNAIIKGDGFLVAVGGTAGGFSNKIKGGTAIEGNGILDINKAYIQGGYATGTNVNYFGLPISEGIKVSKKVIGYAKKGKSVNTIYNSVIPNEYWADITKVPGQDKLQNPLNYTKVEEDAPKLINDLDEINKYLEAPEVNKEPETKEAPEVNKELEAKEAPEVNKESEAKEAPEVNKESEANEAPEVNKESEANEAPEVNKEPEANETPKVNKELETNKKFEIDNKIIIKSYEDNSSEKEKKDIKIHNPNTEGYNIEIFSIILTISALLILTIKEFKFYKK